MSLTNPNSVVTEQRLSEFYQGIYPYLGAGGTTHTVYGIHITNNESVPSAKVQYIADAVGMTPAYMDFTNNTFNYGSWANAFFMPRPCMLKYDGTVDYYLDPSDYTKKADGVTASDVANTSYAGNAMMEWGQNGKKIWLKIEPDATQNNMAAKIYIADYKADSEFTDWNFHNSAGVSVDHFYTPIYNGSLIDGKLRSISGQHLMYNTTAQQEYDYAQANNPTDSLIWTTETIADIDLINILLMLISKTTDSQTAFGMGLCKNGSASIANNFTFGVHNDKGLFYGTNSGTASTYTNAVKVFGMENWWGLKSRRYVGEIMVNGTRKRKLTYNIEDGSTTVGYNFTGSGYITPDISAPSGTTASYISSIVFNRLGLFQSVASGSDTTDYCDGMWFVNSVNCVGPYRGGSSGEEKKAGMFNVCLNDPPTYSSNNYYSAALSARPLS